VNLFAAHRRRQEKSKGCASRQGSSKPLIFNN
jgi:hypothetical protein